MMTSEDNADRMLTKAVALSLQARRRRACAAGIFILLSTGLVACSYRAPDKAAHTKATTSSSAEIAVANPQANGSPDKVHALDKRTLSAFPSTKKPPISTSGETHAMRSERNDKRVVSSTDRVVGDASVTLSPSTVVDAEPLAEARESLASGDSQPVVQSTDDRTASTSSWIWLLAVLALVGAAGAGLIRYRRRRVDTRSHSAELIDEVAVQADLTLQQDNVEQFEGVTAERAELRVVPEVINVESAHVAFSSLEWSYQAPSYERSEHWDTLSPVDFLPASLPVYVSQVVEQKTEPPLVYVEGEETHFPEQVEDELVLVSDKRPLFQLFDQLEIIALRDGDDIPALLIERESALPDVMRTSGEPVSASTLEAWESLLRQAIPDAATLTLPWLLVTTLLLQADHTDNREAESLYEEAEKWIDLSMAADSEQAAAWLARRIDIDLRRTKPQKGAARLLSLRRMQSHYAQDLARGEPSLLFAWIDVLMFWAECQFGDAALAKYTEAETISVRLSELSPSADAAQRRRAEVLRQRATIEEGGARLKSLDTAQTLLDLLYERVPSGDHALAVAVTALARGNVLPPEQAKEAYSHALMHAFMAESEPHLRAESLQCRLAVQWAYENLPGMSVQSDVAVGLTARLETLRVQHPETVQRMAQIYVRNADFAHASALCERAWRSGQATPALLDTWRKACQQWATVSNQPEQLAARQQSMRQLSIASAMR